MPGNQRRRLVGLGVSARRQWRLRGWSHAGVMSSRTFVPAPDRAVQGVVRPARSPAGARPDVAGHLRRVVGNGAVVQRAPAGGLADPFVVKPADDGRSPADMSWGDLQAAIDEQEAFLEEQVSATPEVLRREARLAELRAAQARLAARTRAARPAGRRGASGKARAALPPRPESLEHSLDLDRTPAPVVKAELDRVVAYLAA